MRRILSDKKHIQTVIVSLFKRYQCEIEDNAVNYFTEYWYRSQGVNVYGLQKMIQDLTHEFAGGEEDIVFTIQDIKNILQK